MPRTRAVLLLLASTFYIMGNSGSTRAQPDGRQCEDPKAGRLSITGSASVTETPDTAKVHLSVTVNKPTAAEARDEAAATASAVIGALGGVQGINGDDDVSTENLNLQPNYVWVPETSTQRINGYTFSQQLVVKVNNLTGDTLGEVVDAAVKAGGNNLQVSSIQIELSPELRRQAMDQARSLAVADAANTAAILAEAAKVTLGPIKALTDNNFAPPAPIPYAADMAMAGAARKEMATPVQIGTADVMANVNVEYAIFNQ